MRLSPLDISKQEFTKSLRGYDPAQVRAFLEKVADELADIEAERARLQQENLKLQTQLDSYKQMEESLRESLLTAQKSLEDARAGSQRERDMMLREAKLEAEQVVRDAERRTQTARDELHRLNTQREAYIKRLRFLLSSQQELIDMLEQESPIAETNHDRTSQQN